MKMSQIFLLILWHIPGVKTSPMKTSRWTVTLLPPSTFLSLPHAPHLQDSTGVSLKQPSSSPPTSVRPPYCHQMNLSKILYCTSSLKYPPLPLTEHEDLILSFKLFCHVVPTDFPIFISIVFHRNHPMN